jgi:hypothetical protein
VLIQNRLEKQKRKYEHYSVWHEECTKMKVLVLLFLLMKLMLSFQNEEKKTRMNQHLPQKFKMSSCKNGAATCPLLDPLC